MRTMTIAILVFLLIFTFHEFEEILFLPNWIQKHKMKLRERIKKDFWFKLVSTTTPLKYSLVVFEEYVLLFCFIIFCVYVNNYAFFVGILIGYIFRGLVHVYFTIKMGQYVPGTGTAVVSSILTIFILKIVLKLVNINIIEIVVCSIIFSFLILGNLFVCHYLIENIQIIKKNEFNLNSFFYLTH